MKQVFIHIPRTSGMSIRRYLSSRIQTCGRALHKSFEYSQAVEHTMNQAAEHHGFEHARWRDLHPDYQGRCFSVVRNPWDRTVSRWQFGVVAEGHRYTFDQFLEERHTFGGKEYYWHRAIRGWYPQADYVTDEAGELKVTCLRFGTGDVERFFWVAPMPVRNSTGHSDYRLYYNRKRRQIVADWYAKDVEFFGFDFETGATRNIWTPSS